MIDASFPPRPPLFSLSLTALSSGHYWKYAALTPLGTDLDSCRCRSDNNHINHVVLLQKNQKAGEEGRCDPSPVVREGVADIRVGYLSWVRSTCYRDEDRLYCCELVAICAP